jgi:hypothetical protein
MLSAKQAETVRLLDSRRHHTFLKSHISFITQRKKILPVIITGTVWFGL